MKGIKESQLVANAPIKRDKHLMINDSIEGLEAVEGHLANLIEKIVGSEDTVVDGPGKMPCLSDILDCGSSRIDDIATSLREKIERLEELLF